MPEGVFSIQADIVPQIDERELERQANNISKDLNALLSKNAAKVGISVDPNAFRNFKNQIVNVIQGSNLLTRSFERVRNTVTTLPRVAREGFLKFADAINLTQRNMIGFGKGIIRTIRDTKNFENALLGIRNAGETLKNLPDLFGNIQAQVIAGVSPLRELASRGNLFAAALDPLFNVQVTASRQIDTLTNAVDNLGRVMVATADKGTNLATGVSLLDDNIQAVIEQFQKGAVAGTKFNAIVNEKLQEGLARGGTRQDFIRSLVEIGKVARNGQQSLERVTGPLGFLATLFDKDAKAGRELAKSIDLVRIRAIAQLGGADALSTLQKLRLGIDNLRISANNLKQGLIDAGKGIQTLSAGFLRLTHLQGPVGQLIDSFDTVTSGLVSSLSRGLGLVAGDLRGAISRLGHDLLDGLDKTLAPLAGKFGQVLGKSIVGVGSFLEKNLNAPFKQGLLALKVEATILGQDITHGLRTGMINGLGALINASKRVTDTVLNSLRTFFQSHSDAKTTIPIGHDVASGLATGMKEGQGLVEKAARGLVLGPLKIMRDLVKTSFRALIGKGPSEEVGKIGKAFGAALLPVRLFAQAIGGTLKASLQLGTAALKVAGLALSGFVGAAVATGIQFNSLQAVVRATLPVILGSAAATEKLLKQVNELNDTSPFARSAFLELTRVLAGFGIQAEKIVPLIDAIQQAVAATGGGEQDLLELGQAFARLQSQGRLSLDIIQSFSSRGIDVISILGQQFNKTQGEIRDMISNGLVPADKAIDALTKGLESKFKGATDAVAKNLPGALDRVRAKTRDFGAELTKAFVSPTGGGAAVDLLNSFATIIQKATEFLRGLLSPAIKVVADQISDLSIRAANFAKTLGSFEIKGIKDFASNLDGLLGPMAALTAFIPGLLQTLPIVGPAFASLAGGIPAATIAITAFLLTLAPVREALADLAKQIGPIFGTLLPKASAAFKAFGDAIGPIVGVFLKALGPILRAAGDALGELFTQLVPIFNAFKRLFTALEPVVDILKNAVISQFKGLQAIFMALGPVVTAVINIIAGIAEKLKPTIEAFAQFTDKVQESQVVQKIFEGIINAVGFVIDKLKDFLNIINGILKFAHLPTISFDIDISGTEEAKTALTGITTLSKEASDKLKETLKNAQDVSAGFKDAFNAATKAADDAQAKVGSLTDQLKQQSSTFQQNVDGLISAGNAVKAAHASQAEATKNAKEASAEVNKVLQEQARALRDVITPTDELAMAQRNLTRTQNDLRDMDRQEIALQNQLADLRNEQLTNDKRAELDRAIERAKISLNRARQAELDLINKSNESEKTSLNLAGLSLDEIKSRLSLARASLKSQQAAQQGANKQTAQEKADEQLSAKLDTADAEKALADATKARQQFEIDNNVQIRDTEEQIAAIEADRADKRLEEQTQLQHINDLRAGETAQQAVIKDFEEKIKAARDASAKAAQDVTNAVTASKIAELELKAQAAGVNGEYDKQFGFQQQINALKSTGLEFDTKTEASLKRQSDTIIQIISDLGKAQTDADALAKKAKEAAIALLGAQSLQLDAFTKAVQQGKTDDATFKGLKELPDEIKTILNSISSVGGIQSTGNARFGPAGQQAILTSDFISQILQDVSERQALNQAAIFANPATPFLSFKDILKAILAELGLKIPGFAGGYAPGEVHSGLNNGVGLARMFEYGKEAVLPLTRKFDLQRVVSNPQVLPKILDALPRISLASGSKASDIDGGLGSLRLPGRSTGASSLDRKKEQREFATAVGGAVKTAVKEAISESDSLGADVDINLQPASNNEIIIAREVRRQIEKYLR